MSDDGFARRALFFAVFSTVLSIAAFVFALGAVWGWWA